MTEILELTSATNSRPYGSPACTIPFASPLTVPLDILKKSPKLQAAYESRLPELPTIPEDVGHVLVHYLHTGTYESLRPKPTSTMSKQICELKTSIQAYAAARAYDLPDLMRLAEAKIDKYGEGLPLPALLEVARDAYPTLTEGDGWFLDYLRSRIRPHLKDPKSLLGSNMLDQISGILSPHRVLLRTVLELFCERIVVRPEPVSSPLASPVTSPGSSRPVSPLPPMSPPSLLEMRSRAILRDELPIARRKATPWPSPDVMSEASWSQEASPRPRLPETAPLQLEAKPVPEPQHQTFMDLGPVILDVVPPPGPAIDAKSVVEPEVESTPKPEFKIAIEPEIKADGEPEVKTAPEPQFKLAIEPEVETAPEPEVETTPEPQFKIAIEPEIGAAVELESKATVVPEIEATVEPEIKEEEERARDLVPVRRERKDSGKGIDLEPITKEFDSAPELMSELDTESRPQIQRRVLREVDSGFWETPAEVEPAKELAPSIVEIEPTPAPVPTPELGHELETVAQPKGLPGIDARDFADSDTDADADADAVIKSNKEADSESEIPEEPLPVHLPAQNSASELVAEVPPKAELESIPEPEPLPIKSVDEVAEVSIGTAKSELVLDIAPVEVLPEQIQSKEVEAQPETEKVEPLPRGLEQESALTIQQIQAETVEPEAVAKPEPEPKADSPDPIHLSDDAQPAGCSQSKEAQSVVEPGPKPTGKPEVQGVDTDATLDPATDAGVAKSPAVFSAKPAPEQEGAKTEPDADNVQPCSAQVRQRSWKRRFLSLRYPAGALFGRGM